MDLKDKVIVVTGGGQGLGRVGQPEEIAHTAVFLFENDYMTGRVIEADGGIRL